MALKHLSKHLKFILVTSLRSRVCHTFFVYRNMLHMILMFSLPIVVV